MVSTRLAGSAGDTLEVLPNVTTIASSSSDCLIGFWR